MAILGPSDVDISKRSCQLRGCHNSLLPEQQKYCRPEHYALSLFKTVRSLNPLQRRCIDYMHEQQLSETAFSHRVGLSQSAISKWVTKPGRLLTKTSLERIAAEINIEIAVALNEVGGRTAEDIWQEHRQALGPSRKKLFKEKPESRRAKRLRAASRRGAQTHHQNYPHQTKEHVAEREKSRKKSGGVEAALKGLRKEAESLAGRLNRSLTLSLVRRRKLHPAKEPPGEKDLRAMAGNTAVVFDLCIGEVIVVWNPSLRRRGLPAIGGDVPDADRCRQQRQWLGEQAHANENPRPAGFWSFSPEAKGWCQAHARGCPTLHRLLVPDPPKQPGRPGRRPRLSETAILSAAAALVAREGIARLTIRRVADELGCGPPAVYRYVQDKDQLIRLLGKAQNGI